jgi:hypothetical protein
MSTDKETIGILRNALMPPVDGKVVGLRFNAYGPYLYADQIKLLIDTLEKRLSQHLIAEMLGDDSLLINPLEKMTIRLLMETSGIMESGVALKDS